MTPNRLIVRAFASRAAGLWLLSRAMVSGLFAFAGTNPLALSPVVVAAIVGMCIALCVADSWRRRERALLGNLGVGPLALGGLFALPVLAGEVALGICASMLR